MTATGRHSCKWLAAAPANLAHHDEGHRPEEQTDSDEDRADGP